MSFPTFDALTDELGQLFLDQQYAAALDLATAGAAEQVEAGGRVVVYGYGTVDPAKDVLLLGVARQIA